MSNENAKHDQNHRTTNLGISKETGDIRQIKLDASDRVLMGASNNTPFGEPMVSSKTNVMELKSTYGFSVLRSNKVTNGSGSVSNGNGIYTLSTTASANDSAQLNSNERGRYIPGFGAEAGLGVRIPNSPTGEQIAHWGYFDDNNGFGFGVDATGIFVFRRSGGTETKVRQSNWNVDTFDGDGNSGIDLDLSDGHIFQIQFSWYGYGVIEYQIVTSDSSNIQESYTVHRERIKGEVSTPNPNLPIRINIDNNATAEAFTAEVGGRQFSVQGNYSPNRRINGERNLQTGSIGTTFLPLISFRRKSAFESVSVKVEGIDVLTDADLVYELRVNASLTSASYGTPTNTTASETACEADTSATAISGGELIYSGLIDSAGTGSNTSGGMSTGVIGFDIPENEPITLAVRRVSGTDATVSAAVRWREEW